MNGESSIEKCIACRGTSAEKAIVWNSIPVPSFGNPAHAKVATVGLNPAWNEPRLPTLINYRKNSREELNDSNAKGCARRRENYFTTSENDWHNYFVTLDSFLGRVNHLWSYTRNVAHIDLVACVTTNRFGEILEKSRDVLIENCSQHLLKTLMQLPKDALLLLDGRTVCNNLLRFGEVNFDVEPEKLLTNPKLEGLRGSVTIHKMQFKFRGWNLPVSKLAPLQRMDLANWLHDHCS